MLPGSIVPILSQGNQARTPAWEEMLFHLMHLYYLSDLE